ncbi:hydroxysqualene dehydroxylase HpnE [Novosphingobium nitrogenifigens]|uniref:hydroxysqualene dehydroxylase HpnE n=1 Tax=Novosphingobium nitrogenifigens TaxID=378548 RepID=UPI000318B9D6|nr:hydroxysqualene dehydroxylase HpnE [Novosphingobium nitrogenifigens]
MTFARATIAGAGLAGLSSAVRLIEAGLSVSIGDGAARAGGRCRSYFDRQLGQVIDNGNHLVLAGNRAVADFRRTVGAIAPLEGPDQADFPFADLATGDRWTLRINDGRVPWWVLVKSRRVPGTGASDYLALGKLLSGKPGQTVGDRVPTTGPLWDRMLDPVLLAILNTAPAIGSAELTAAVVRESLALGGKASLPRIASPTLAAAFIDPATDWLEAHGAPVALGRRLRSIETTGDRVTALDWGAGPEPVVADEAVVLAVPSWVAKGLLPEISVPDAFHSIVNAHFAFTPPPGAPLMLGLLGATGQWLFAFEDRISVTVSAADDIVDHDREELAYRFWDEIQRAYGFCAPMPAWQIVKEKRATFSATPEQDAKRPPARTRWRNLFLAGDWTATGLPATIEGALRSGETAARTVLGKA